MLYVGQFIFHLPFDLTHGKWQMENGKFKWSSYLCGSKRNLIVMDYYITKTYKGKIADAREKVETALKEQGFAIITEINVAGTFKEKLGEDFKDYVILGACNAGLAFRGINAEDKLGILLPCNVILIDQGEENIEVAAMDPRTMMDSLGNPQLTEMAAEVFSKLEKMMEAV